MIKVPPALFERLRDIAVYAAYGLSSAVFTRDEGRGLRFALRMEAGMTHINDQTVNDLPNSPFGGEKNSGIGVLAVIGQSRSLLLITGLPCSILRALMPSDRR